MSDRPEIVERLRGEAGRQSYRDPVKLCGDAADLIEALWDSYRVTLKFYGVGEDWGEIGLALERVEELTHEP